MCEGLSRHHQHMLGNNRQRRMSMVWIVGTVGVRGVIGEAPVQNRVILFVNQLLHVLQQAPERPVAIEIQIHVDASVVVGQQHAGHISRVCKWKQRQAVQRLPFSNISTAGNAAQKNITLTIDLHTPYKCSNIGKYCW